MERTQGIGVPGGPIRLWIPGLGVTDLRIYRVAKAVDEYDHALRLARHEHTGDWVVVIGDQGFPVFGFGKELPHPEDVPRILEKHDMKRHGKKLMDQLARKTEQDRLDAKYRQDEQHYQLAEHLEHGFRREGKHPVPRIFIPRTYSGRS